MAAKPTLFIGTSVEGHRYGYAIQELLEYVAAPTVWDQGVFTPTSTTMESLIAATRRFDFAALVLSPDDIVQLRNQTFRSARDNVVFELGLFIGSLGRDRSFIVMPRGIEDFRLPTDLIGTTPLTFDGTRADETGALGPVANKIRRQIEAVGSRDPIRPPVRSGVQVESGSAGGRLTVWVIGSYTSLTEEERSHAAKLVSILAKGFANTGVRVFMGESDMLREFARQYRDTAFASETLTPNPVVLPGRLRRENIRDVFADAVGRIPDLALVIGGNTERNRVVEEAEAARAGGIPILAISTTGGTAASIATTAEIEPQLRQILSEQPRRVDSGDVAARILEAVRMMATAKLRHAGETTGPAA